MRRLRRQASGRASGLPVEDSRQLKLLQWGNARQQGLALLSAVMSCLLALMPAHSLRASEQAGNASEPDAGDTRVLKAAMTANVRFADRDGNSLTVLPRDETFQIEVTLENLAGSEPPAGLFLNGWLRPQSLRNMPCVEAARTYLATQRTPIGSIDLNGPAIGVLAEDGAFTIVDPELNLASANMIGATTFDELPVTLVADPAQARFLVALRGAGSELSVDTDTSSGVANGSTSSTGSVQAVNVFGAAKEILLDELDQPESLVPDGVGGFWVLEKGSGRVSRVDPTGLVVWQKELDASVLRVGAAKNSLLVISGNELHLLDLVTGEERVRFHVNDQISVASPGESANKIVIDSVNTLAGQAHVDEPNVMVSDAVPLGDEAGPFAIAVVVGKYLQIRYLDDIDEPIEIALADAATTLTTDRDGRFVFAYSPQGGATSIVDVARSHLAQVIGSNPTIADIEFAGRAAYLMLADQTLTGVIDLASIRYGKHAEVREVSLGTADQGARDVSSLMTPLFPSNSMLAVHAASYTGFSIEDSSTMGDSPPMTAIRLRGGIPHKVESLDRSFREVNTGRFVASARIPQQGQFELVVTTGIGSVTACFPVPTDTDLTTSIRLPGRMTLSADPDSPGQQRLQLLDSEGKPIRGIDAEVTFSALESHWRKNDSLRTDAQGISVEGYALPPLGAFVVTIHSDDDNQFQPLMVEIRQ